MFDFEKQGYFIAKNVIDISLIKGLKSQIHQLVIQQLEYLNISHSSQYNDEKFMMDLEKLYRSDVNRYLSTLRLAAKLSLCYQIYLSQDMMETVSQFRLNILLFQTQPVLHIMSERLKIENGYFGVGAHQDWPALQSGLDTLTSWVPLFPVEKGKYTLEVIPGSHRMGLVPSTVEQHINKVDPNVYKESDFLPVKLDPGDALFFSTFLIHRSEPYGDSNVLRASLSMRYENASCPYFIKRSYPSAQKRMIDREISEENKPGLEEVKKIYS